MEKIRLISVRELDTYVNLYPQITLLDVRTEEEYHASHICHAINIPYREGIVWKLPRWKKVVVYCERGSASMMAARELQKLGYRVVSVAGGIQEYRGTNLVFSEHA